MLVTEFPFTLPMGYVDSEGTRHREGVMRLATAYDEIAPMKDPLTMSAPRTRLCGNDDYTWERVGERAPGRGLNEAPEVLQRGGRVFVSYSCSGSQGNSAL